MHNPSLSSSSQFPLNKTSRFSFSLRNTPHYKTKMGSKRQVDYEARYLSSHFWEPKMVHLQYCCKNKQIFFNIYIYCLVQSRLTVNSLN